MDEKIKDVKKDLDNIILDDLNWIDIVCSKEGFSVAEYQQYYIDKLDEKNIYSKRKV